MLTEPQMKRAWRELGVAIDQATADGSSPEMFLTRLSLLLTYALPDYADFEDAVTQALAAGKAAAHEPSDMKAVLES